MLKSLALDMSGGEVNSIRVMALLKSLLRGNLLP